MADDAMDWHPSTPLMPHNPYTHPHYIPGGWPVSPPSHRITTGAFDRKRPATLIERAAKKICTGVSAVATITAIPIHIIVRRWNSRHRRRSRRSLPPQNPELSTTPTYVWFDRPQAGAKQTAPFEKRRESSPKIDSHPTLEEFLTARQEVENQIQDSVRRRQTPLKRKRMKETNRFDADWKPSATAYSARGLAPSHHIKAIGEKVETSGKAVDLWGGWEHEKPISRSTSPDPSEQMKSELQSHISEVRSETGLGQTSPKGQTKPLTKLADERWASGPVLELFFPDDYYEPLPKDENADDEPKRLFYENTMVRPPPPVRRRPILPQGWVNSSLDHSNKQTYPEDEKTEMHETASSNDNPAEAKAEDGVEANNTRQGVVLHHDKPIKKETAESPPRKASIDGKITAAPVTPTKAVVEKAAQKDDKSKVFGIARDSFETPAQSFSKLKITDTGDNDTPKATPHSGTKTTRVTRYREALEKAQKAKLEQYELVPISGDWDKKVRAAVRNGVHDLGPRDLARVVPQYADRGQDNWLNDETINKYLELVAAHGRKNDRPDQVPSHHAFNNFFYNNLKAKGAAAVARWAKRAKIGGTNLMYVEKVFVPINSGAHWTLAVVEPTQKRITHYNSMRGTATGIRACEDLKGWVAMEQGKAFKEDEWELTAVGESPQQTNSDDCGVFTITSARQIMLGYTPTSYGSAQIPMQRIRIVAELINKGLLRSGDEA